MTGKRRALSLPLFADLITLWKGWQVGIPPVGGIGVQQMNANLLAAFEALDRAKAKADEERAGG